MTTYRYLILPEQNYTDTVIPYILSLDNQRVEFLMPSRSHVFVEINRYDSTTLRNKKCWNTGLPVVEYVLKDITQQDLIFMKLLNLSTLVLDIDQYITKEHAYPLYAGNVIQIGDYIRASL